MRGREPPLGPRPDPPRRVLEAHESLEDAWRAADAAEKDFFQGLVHVAVAWHHAGRGNRPGCERQLIKARRRLGPFAPAHRGVDLELLLRCVDDAAAAVSAGSLALPPPLLPRTSGDETEIARDKPYGASVVVWRRTAARREYLLLHRTLPGPPQYEGDWAWTPPSGARRPGEPVEDTARSELREKTRLELPLVATELGSDEWAVYAAEAPADAEVVVGAEHDRFRWVGADEAARICLPASVGRTVAAVDAWLDSDRPEPDQLERAVDADAEPPVAVEEEG